MVIPAYRAEKTIGLLVRQVVIQGLPTIVVDDASNDETARKAEEAGALVIRRTKNGGKGTALRQGLEEALRRDYGWFLTMDADGQHVPAEIGCFLEAAARGNEDLILGNRMGKPMRMPIERRLTNRFMSWLLSRVAGQKIPDSQCGFRLISRQVLERVRLISERFEIESELVVKSIWKGFSVASIPVSSIYRREISFIRPLKDTVRFIRFLIGLRSERPQ